MPKSKAKKFFMGLFLTLVWIGWVTFLLVGIPWVFGVDFENKMYKLSTKDTIVYICSVLVFYITAVPLAIALKLSYWEWRDKKRYKIIDDGYQDGYHFRKVVEYNENVKEIDHE